MSDPSFEARDFRHTASSRILAHVWAAAASESDVQPVERPLLVEKVRDIVGLYLDSPAHAAVFFVDVKSQNWACARDDDAEQVDLRVRCGEPAHGGGRKLGAHGAPGGETGAATYDAANQLASWNGVAVTSDANGNMIGDGTRTFTWDVQNRLVSLSAATPASFVYDGLGRRTQKTVRIGDAILSVGARGLMSVEERGSL